MLQQLLMGLPGAVKSGLGLFQLIKGAGMEPKRPNYEIPKSAGEGLALSRQAAFSRNPGAVQAMESTRQSGATGLSRLEGSAGGINQLLGGLAAITASTNAAERGILANEASDRFRRVANLQRSLGQMAQYQDKKFQINEMEPYLNEARTKAALMGGGFQNLFGGVGDAVSGIAGYRYNQQLMKLLGN